MKNTLSIYRTKDGFIVEERKDHIMVSSARYFGGIPRLDIWLENPELWLFLLENNIFKLKEIESKDDDSLLLVISFQRDRTTNFSNIERFTDEADFIMSLIDKIELELVKDEAFNASDFIRLSSLEKLCHDRNINLSDFFLALEKDIDIDFNKQRYLCLQTNACIYYQAIDIILDALDYSYKKLSLITGINHANLLSDKSDSIRGKRKTIELRTLFKITKAMEISFCVFFDLCRLIKESY